ncbi:MAG: hypothetical protein ACKPB0_03490 [Opitutaceae bacterium]
MDPDRFTPEAALLWAVLPAPVRERAVNHAWCRMCRDRVAMPPGWAGRVEAGKLVLDGSCPRCGAHITRVIDANTAEPPPN